MKLKNQSFKGGDWEEFSCDKKNPVNSDSDLHSTQNINLVKLSKDCI